MTPAELAGLLNVPLSTIYRWNKRGTGPAFVQLGKHIRYRSSDVTAWLDTQRAKRLRVVQ